MADWGSSSGWGGGGLAAASAADFPAAAVRRAAAARRGAGDAAHAARITPPSPPLSARRKPHTSGQIVCVLAHSSSDYAHVPILWASVLALLAAMAADLFHAMERAADFSAPARGVHRRRRWFSPGRRCGFAGAARACGARGRTAPRWSNSSCAGVAHTKNRTGVLIFVSLAERYARIIADEGIAEKVQGAEWQAAIDALTGHMRDGRIAQGFVAAIERCGAVLAAHAPPDGSPERLAGSALCDVGGFLPGYGRR